MASHLFSSESLADNFRVLVDPSWTRRCPIFGTIRPVDKFGEERLAEVEHQSEVHAREKRTRFSCGSGRIGEHSRLSCCT
jgi:hypothetical protein